MIFEGLPEEEAQRLREECDRESVELEEDTAPDEKPRSAPKDLKTMLQQCIVNRDPSTGYGCWVVTFTWKEGDQGQETCTVQFNTPRKIDSSLEKSRFKEIMRQLSAMPNLESLTIKNMRVIDFRTLSMNVNSSRANPFPALKTLHMNTTVQFLHLKPKYQFPNSLDTFEAPKMIANEYLRRAFRAGNTEVKCRSNAEHLFRHETIRVAPFAYSLAKIVPVSSEEMIWTGAEAGKKAWVDGEVYATPQFRERTFLNRVKYWAQRFWNLICRAYKKVKPHLATAFLTLLPALIAKWFPKLPKILVGVVEKFITAIVGLVA